MAGLVAACRARGLHPFVIVNVLRVAPPCTVSEAEGGLSILDEALVVAGSHVVG